jgi:hypothetical protein
MLVRSLLVRVLPALVLTASLAASAPVRLIGSGGTFGGSVHGYFTKDK